MVDSALNSTAGKDGLRNQLREAEAYFTALLDAAVDAIIVIDHDGVIRAFNTAAQCMFGYAVEEALGRNVNMLMPEPHRTAHDNYIEKYLTTGVAKIIGIGREERAVRKDGTEFPMDLAIGEVQHAGNPHFVGIIKDITEHRRLEQEAHQMQRELAHVTRLSVLGEMASGIAHEINQPLTAISTYAQACQRMLKNTDADPAELQNALKMVSEQAHRAGEVIRRLRAFAKKRSTERQIAQVSDLIESALRLAEPDSRTRKFDIHLQLADALPAVIVDAVQIQQVVLNLLRNAMDAVEEWDSEDRVVTVTAESDEDGYVKISFTDGGAGLSPEAIEHLFDPFFTTKESGMGLGLSISRSIVTSHGGEISFHANPQGGTTFYFTIPPVVRKE